MVCHKESAHVMRHCSIGLLLKSIISAGLYLWALAVSPAASSEAMFVSPACSDLRERGDTGEDVTDFFQKCLDSLPSMAQLALPSKTYILKQQLFIRKSVTISTEHNGKAPYKCGDAASLGCATLKLRPDRTFMARGPKGLTSRPIVVSASNTTLDRISINGFKDEINRASLCNATGASGHANGIIGISSDGFTLSDSMITGSPCNGAISVLPSKKGLTLRGNLIASNGSHTQAGLWADGATVFDAEHAIIEANTFRDNTDVQLIVGGCRDCTIRDNRFLHSQSKDGGSYANLMLAGWPNTSGDFSGTVVERNTIDCGPMRNCGYGIMYGGRPWYNSKASGGLIKDNVVANAKLAVNVNDATGPVEFARNIVENSGGKYPAACGNVTVGSINISVVSQHYVKGDLAAITTRTPNTNFDFYKCGLK